MEEVKAEDTSIKTIVRIKGNLLEKVKNKLNQKNSAPAIVPAVENDSINNNHNNNANPGVKKEVQSAKSNVIIHTVEKVQIDVASILKNDIHSQKSVDQLTPIADESSTQEKGSQKILAAKMPENQFNKTVPLKMIRKINKPPVNLNVQRKRFGNVQVHTSQSLPTVTVQNTEDPKAINDQNKKEGSPVTEFKGFDSTENNSTLDDKLKLWKECLLNDNIISDILSKKPKLSQQEKQEECKASQDSTVETMPSTSLMEISTSQLITDSMVDSSMMREFADELKDTAEASNIETEGEDFSDDEDEMEDSEEEDIGSEVMDCDEAYWLSDVVDLIGGPRIREIDKELKKIPSIVTGNKIQAENVELKLIINHLLKKLNKQSVVETLDTEAVNNQHENDEDPPNDDNSSSHSNNYDDQPMDFDDDLTNNASNHQNEEETNNTYETTTISPFRQPTQQLTVSEPAIEISQVKSENSSAIQIVKNLAQKRKNEHEPLATSTVKKMKPAPCYDLINMDLKKSPEKTTGRRGRTSKRPLEQIKEAVEVFQEEKKRETRGRPKKDQTKIKEKSPSPQRLVIETQVDKPRRQYSKLVSDHEISSNEMKLSDDNLSSRLAPSSSSQPPDCESRSNALEYPSSPSSSFHLDTRKNILISKTNPIIDEVKKTVRQKKKADVTYREPVKVEKRPYLKTSAFTGNIKEEVEVNATDHSSSVTPDDYEVSTILNESPANEELSTNDTKQNLQNLMNSLINGEDAIKKNMLPISPKPKHSKEKRVVEKKKTDVVRKKINTRAYHPVPKRVFEQEPLENADNRRVPYVEIIESKRISDPPRSEKGKAKWHIPAYTPAEIKKLRKELEMLDYFQCGMCNFLVTKHKWKDHLFLHGGFAYIEGFETPLNILDFNESVRRMIHYARIYKMEIFRCPHCNDTKKSALGQLSHLFTCGEDLETLELRKMKCELCDAHIMPFSMSAHTKCCKGVKAIELMHQIKAEEEDPSDEEYTNTGRKSRKAVKKAIENFKKMTVDERMEHICTLSDGVSKCHICDEKFASQKLALEHLKSVHGISKETNDDDDNMSSADEYVGSNASDNESESDGSSGVDDNESVEGGESGDEDRTSDNGIDNSKGRAWKVDSEETKKSRKLVAEYMEVLKTIKIPAKLLELQRDFINDTLSPEIFPLTIPLFVIESSDLSSFLTQLNFKSSSMHFLANEVISYETEFEKSFEKQSWLQLKLGSSHVNDNFTQIFYCGGSVSSLDWAPSNSETNFLAVACNNKKYQNVIGLEQTSTACIQIYEFQSLVNEGFHNFENVKSSLIYSFAIDDGPVWSIKFHPCGYANSERIGILAVTTSQQNVLVFSLPYLKDEKSSIAIRLEPSFICRISEEMMLYQDAFLLQATRVEWHYEKDLSNVLIVGYVNGYVALFNFDENDDEENVKLPETVIQAHRESISAVDVKIGTGGQFFLLTASIGRVIKLFSIDHTQYEEVAVYHPTSRTFCAKFAAHWPAFVIGNDNCYALGNLTLRQPFEFANKNVSLMTPSESIMCLDVCRWTSAILFGTESGDVLGCQSRQLVYNVKSKDPWGTFKNSVHGYTDLKKIPKSEGGIAQVGIVFNDLRANITKKPKKFRVVPSELSNQLQINHVCFNRNENSYRFYALAYETGFIRIKHMKNSTAK